MKVLVVIGIVVVVLAAVIILAYNRLVKNKIKCEEAFATMDVYLKKRFDLIPNLIKVVKGYTSYEADTLQKIIDSRNNGMHVSFRDEQKISDSVSSIFALAENYPELKAEQGFVDLQRQLKSVEDDIANARKYYNACVREFNNSVVVFPASLVAKMCSFSKMEMFQIGDSEKQNVDAEI